MTYLRQVVIIYFGLRLPKLGIDWLINGRASGASVLSIWRLGFTKPFGHSRNE